MAAPHISTSTFTPTSGVTGEFHLVEGPHDVYEKTYEVGGRYYRTYGKFVPFAKVMYGRGVFNFPPLGDGFHANLAYNIAAIGIGTDYKVKPGSTSAATGNIRHGSAFVNSSLTPNILTVGAAYRFR